MGKRLILLLSIVTTVMVSCSKDSDSLNNNKLSAKISGKSWNAAVRVSTLTSDVFVITGTSALGEVLVITIKGNSPDLYELNLTSLECNATYKKSALSTSTEDIYNSISGRVNLTKVDMVNKKISGTFDFTLVKLSVETVSVSEGTFNDLEFSVNSI